MRQKRCVRRQAAERALALTMELKEFRDNMKDKRPCPHGQWRQRGCDSEVLITLCLIMLGEHWCIYEKLLKIEKQVLLVPPSPTANLLKKSTI